VHPRGPAQGGFGNVEREPLSAFVTLQHGGEVMTRARPEVDDQAVCGGLRDSRREWRKVSFPEEAAPRLDHGGAISFGQPFSGTQKGIALFGKVETVGVLASQRAGKRRQPGLANRASQRGDHIGGEHRAIFNDVTLSIDDIARAPKALLHDHLDGGLRPQTIIELAAEIGHALPARDPVALGEWFVAAADSGSLERYLETFAHTVAVMQSAESLRRVAAECAVDLAADGVVYAEVRFAPEQHLVGGLTLPQVVEAVQAGFAQGSAEAARSGQLIRVGTLLTAMRHAARSMEIAELAIAYRDHGVVGFDIAGAEAG
jgi:hypothetical protein